MNKKKKNVMRKHRRSNVRRKKKLKAQRALIRQT